MTNMLYFIWLCALVCVCMCERVFLCCVTLVITLRTMSRGVFNSSYVNMSTKSCQFYWYICVTKPSRIAQITINISNNESNAPKSHELTSVQKVTDLFVLTINKIVDGNYFKFIAQSKMHTPHTPFRPIFFIYCTLKLWNGSNDKK